MNKILRFVNMINELMSTFSKEWPLSSTITAMDTWLFGCYIVVFYPLAEYCIIL